MGTANIRGLIRLLSIKGISRMIFVMDMDSYIKMVNSNIKENGLMVK